MSVTQPPAQKRSKRRAASRTRKGSVDPTRLGQTQLKAIEAELQGEAHDSIRRRLGIARSTWYRWHDVEQTPHYVADLARRRTEAAAEVHELVRSRQRTAVEQVEDALETLRFIMQSDAVDPGVRVRAADALARNRMQTLEQSGFRPPEAPPPDQDAAAKGLRSMIEGVRDAIKAAGGVVALISAPPTKPSEDELDPFEALARERAKIAELEAEVQRLKIRGA